MSTEDHVVNEGGNIQGSDLNDNEYAETEDSPIIDPRERDENKVDGKEDNHRKRSNMLRMIAICGISMLGYGIYGAAYDQWIYVRFAKDALGNNFSQLHHLSARDPCFRGNKSESPYKSDLLQAQAKTARFGVWTMLCALIPSLFTNILLGVFSDQIGRRLIFIAPMAGNVIRVAITCAVALWDLNVHYILIGSFINGVSGDFGAFFMAMFVYTADNTSKGNNRSLLMVFAQAMNFICYYLTLLASGYYIEAEGYVWPMVTGLGALFLSFVLCLFFIRETLDKSQVRRQGMILGIKSIFGFYFEEPENPLFRKGDFIVLGLVIFVYGSSLGGIAITTIFLMSEPFCWGSTRLGNVQSSFGLANALLSTGLMKLMHLIMGDEQVALLSLLAGIANRFLFAFANYNWQIYTAYAVSALELPVLAIIRSILSRMIRPNQRGSLFASVAVIETATFAMSGAGLNELYASTVAEWKGLTFFVIGCIVFVSALILFIYIIVISRRRAKSPALVVNGSAQRYDSETRAERTSSDSSGIINAAGVDYEDVY
ncbi:proton-coupled folate transporter-like [Plakobranchus ocellatus]|uniref:Proton-coupled folate transporter-like n=1 Tax=Plakobranchus ocellatus TaxID=259542 RepID=A0AAV4DLU6_9GAST|nr:proton-coupled folate transporter-like [Plakobranchus ocellatus]